MKIHPTHTADQLAIAWAAGLFEGEGCFSATHRKSGKAIVVATLSTTDRDVLERFAAIIGCGAIYQRKPGTNGHKPVFEWRVVESAKVRDIITTLMPYLGERRRATAQRVLGIALEIRPHNSLKTHCPKGHPLEGDNLLLEPYLRKGVRYFARRCLLCSRTRSRDRMRRIHNTSAENYRIKE